MISGFGTSQERVWVPQPPPPPPEKIFKGSVDGQYSSSHWLNKPLLKEICCAIYLYLMIRVKTYKVNKLSSPQRAQALTN